MIARIIVLSLACLPLTAKAADDGRFSFLEQEVRNLQRQVQALTRRIDELDTRPARIERRPGMPKPTSGATGGEQWIDAARWQRLRPGMTELEVISLLGRPTSMRDESGARVLYYALEIGSSGFLGGSVLFRDKAVAEVRLPSLQ